MTSIDCYSVDGMYQLVSSKDPFHCTLRKLDHSHKIDGRSPWLISPKFLSLFKNNARFLKLFFVVFMEGRGKGDVKGVMRCGKRINFGWVANRFLF